MNFLSRHGTDALLSGTDRTTNYTSESSLHRPGAFTPSSLVGNTKDTGARLQRLSVWELRIICPMAKVMLAQSTLNQAFNIVPRLRSQIQVRPGTLLPQGFLDDLLVDFERTHAYSANALGGRNVRK